MNPNGNVKHGGHGTLTYSRWKSMRQRCLDPNHRAFSRYGGAGVTIDAAWLESFEAFLRDMGECPTARHTLERDENTKGYGPGNCRWATRAEQNANRRSCVELTWNGKTQNVTEWAKELGMSANALNQRLYLGWTFERALTTPLKARSK
jgi:hypothetical protein